MTVTSFMAYFSLHDIVEKQIKNYLPTLSHLIAKLKHIEFVERSIARPKKKNNRLKTHDGKWKPFIALNHTMRHKNLVE